jgi:hypothetical protein
MESTSRKFLVYMESMLSRAMYKRVIHKVTLPWYQCGCWFTLAAVKIYVTTMEALRKKERQDETLM